jgi:hypothetical protein
METRIAPLRTLSLALAATLLAAATLPALAQEAAAAGPAPASAAGPVYNVEIIVFRAAGALGGAENWSAEAGARYIAGDESASGSTQVGRFVAALPPAVWQLNELENRLRASGTYVPVAHAAWSQTASSWGTRAGFSMQRLGISVPGLSGTVFLERGQFLHVGMSLTYTMPNPPPGLGAAPGTTFTLNESRRVKFYERNYFDHPAFGVIALVTPVQGARAPGR